MFLREYTIIVIMFSAVLHCFEDKSTFFIHCKILHLSDAFYIAESIFYTSAFSSISELHGSNPKSDGFEDYSKSTVSASRWEWSESVSASTAILRRSSINSQQFTSFQLRFWYSGKLSRYSLYNCHFSLVNLCSSPIRFILTRDGYHNGLRKLQRDVSRCISGMTVPQFQGTQIGTTITVITLGERTLEKRQIIVMLLVNDPVLGHTFVTEGEWLGECP